MISLGLRPTLTIFEGVSLIPLLTHRAEDVESELECELYEFYNGAIKEVNYFKKKMLSTTD